MRALDGDAYIHFMFLFVRAVTGSDEWEKSYGKSRDVSGPLRTFEATVSQSDEAATLLLMEDNWNKWVDDMDCATQAGLLQTTEGGEVLAGKKRWCTKKAGNRSHGWSIKGQDRWDAIMKAVEDDREARGDEFEERWSSWISNKLSEGSKGKKKKKEGLRDTATAACFDR